MEGRGYESINGWIPGVDPDTDWVPSAELVFVVNSIHAALTDCSSFKFIFNTT